MKPGPIVAFIVLVGAAVVTFVSFSQATAKHVTVAEAKKSQGVVVQVPGRIERGTVSFRVLNNRPELRFEITDLNGSGERMTIVYRKPKPENFQNATSVEAIGRFQNGVFEATTLLVKCPSRYRGKDAS